MRVTKKSTIALLKLAKQKIQEGGLSKGSFWRGKNGRDLPEPKPGCRCCSLGAIRYANQELFGTGSHHQDAAIKVMRKAMLGVSYLTIIRYNDRPETKKKDILRLFDSTISQLESGKIKMGDVT